MAVDNGQTSFRRGVMSLVILALLKREDMYGYQQNRVGGVVPLLLIMGE